MTTEMQRTEVAASADGTTKATTSKWLSGIYAPVAEEVTAFDLPVRGELPPELDGRYVRNGPNPMSAVDPATHHWFVGDAMVHGVRLRDGKAEWYRNRWVRSTAISAALGEEPAPGERHGGMETAITNVIGLAGRTYAIVEAGARPVELSTDLDTICHSDLDGTLPHGYTAHPKVDPVTGNVHAIAYHWALPHLEYVVIGPDGRVLQIEAIAVAGGPMVHDCSITERWGVVYDLPVTFDLETAMAGASFPYRWNEGRAARVGILPLGGLGTDVRWFEVEPCYVFHPMNAYDDGDRVVLDVVRYPAHVRRQPARTRRRRTAAVAVDARHGHRPGPRGTALGRGDGVPQDRRAAGRPAVPVGLRHRGGAVRRQPVRWPAAARRPVHR